MQQDSRTKKITIFYRGKHYGLSELAGIHKVHPATLKRRLTKGLPIDEALGK